MTFRDDLIASLPERTPGSESPAASVWTTPSPHVMALVSGEETLTAFSAGHRRVGRQVSSAGYDVLAQWLTQRSLEVGASTAVDDLERYLNATEFRCEFILAVGGLIVDAPITLADGVTLRPYSRSAFLADDTMLASWPQIGGQALDTISAAFSLSVAHPKQHFTCEPPVDKEQEAAERVAMGIEDDAWERLRRARACVALAEPSPSYEVGTAVVLDPAVPCAHTTSARNWFTEDHGGGVRGLRGALVETARTIHRQFLSLPATQQARLILPMHRLERALHPRADPVDAAIDLGIALEAALLGPEANSELGYRLSVRGACLIGTTTADRRWRQRQLNTLYALRSKAVHTGALPAKPPGGIWGTVGEALADGMRLAAQIIQTLIARGGVVDWDDVVLGPPLTRHD